jgi:hypothetical protein
MRVRAELSQIDREKAVRAGISLAILAGAVLLIVADLSPLRDIVVLITVKDRLMAGEHHGFLLLAIGVLSLVLSRRALIERDRTATARIAALAVGALAIILVIDVPVLGSNNGLDQLYSNVSVHVRDGFVLELIGSLLLLGGACVQLMKSSRARHSEARSFVLNS